VSARGSRPVDSVAPAAKPAPARKTPARRAARDTPASGLEPFRRRLDELDDEIARLFGERFAICREIALYKRAHDIPMMQPQRVVEVRKRYLARGAEVELPQDFTAELFELLIDATCKMEDELIDGPSIIAAPSLDDVPYVDTPPSADTPPRADTPPSADAPPRADTPLSADASPRVDTPPSVETPPPADTPSAAPEGPAGEGPAR
jgi:chorismate mutase